MLSISYLCHVNNNGIILYRIDMGGMKMEIALKPFILIYHMVYYLLRGPRKILSYAHSGVLSILDKLSLTKSQHDDEVEEQIEALMLDGIKKNTPKKKEEPLVSFRYKAKTATGKIVKSTFEGASMQDAKNFLQNEGYEVLEISFRKSYDIDINIGGGFKANDLAFTLTQLSTYLKAGIPLIDSVRILEKQSENLSHRKIYQKLVYELLKGESLSVAMAKQEDKFPKLLVNMVKTAELTGDLTTVLDDMADYYTSKDENRKQMISAMTYPAVVLLVAIAVVIFILVTIVPKFVEMYVTNDAELPKITIFVMNVSKFFTSHYMFIVLLFLLIIAGIYLCYKNIKEFRQSVQIILMHIPVFGKVIIYSEVYNFTKTFASLLNHGVFITDSMEILAKITDNEVYKHLIAKTIINLNKGASISESFKGHWAFPVAAYEMIVTGESTGQLGLMMEKVANYYQTLHKNLVKQIQSLIEPIMIAFLAVIVGTILLSVVMPMFDIYGKIQ